MSMILQITNDKTNLHANYMSLQNQIEIIHRLRKI